MTGSANGMIKAWLLRGAYGLYKIQWQVLRPITLGVRLLLVDDGQVVLVRHTYQPGWHFPGGAMKRGELPARAAEREGIEEAGAQVLDEPRLLGVYSNFEGGQSNHVFVFVSEAFRLGVPTDRWEIAERGLFPLEQLPAEVTPGSRRRVAEYMAGAWPVMGMW